MKILNPSSGRNPDYLNDYKSYTHKKCTKCGEIKSLDRFSTGVTKGNRIGWAYRSYCKDCGNKKTREYAIGNREKRNARLREYRRKNPDKARLYDKRGRFKSKYKLSLSAVEELKMANNNKCWICDRYSKKLFVDHCHNTNKIRGMLCPQCNSFLGYINDNIHTIELMREYIMGNPCHADVLLKYANQ